MQRIAWNKRVTMGIGVGLLSVALIAGCGDEEDPINGDGTDLGTDGTTATVTATLPTVEATEATATGTATGTATDGTATATATVPDAAGTDIPATVVITADGLMQDELPAGDIAVEAGSSVTFQNDTDSAVSLSTEDGTIDEEIEAGASYEHTFDEAGTWTVLIDDEEAGTVTVS